MVAGSTTPSSVIQPWDVQFRGCGLLSQLIQIDQNTRGLHKQSCFMAIFTGLVINTLANAFYDKHVLYRAQLTFLWQSEFFHITKRHIYHEIYLPQVAYCCLHFICHQKGLVYTALGPGHPLSGYFWIRKFFSTSFPEFSPTCPMGRREPWERGWLFLCGFGFPPHASDEFGIRICNFLNLLSGVKIFENMNPESCRRCPVIFVIRWHKAT